VAKSGKGRREAKGRVPNESEKDEKEGGRESKVKADRGAIAQEKNNMRGVGEVIAL